MIKLIPWTKYLVTKMFFKTPKVIGITGGIGSGKTTVANMIEQMGYPVYYSDEVAKEIVYQKELRNKIISLFGSEAYDEQGFYNRKWISQKVFSNQNLLSQLNHLIHPEVRKHFNKWLSLQTCEIVFKESAILFEVGLDRDCFKTILVVAPKEDRIHRVMKRDGRTREEVIKIIQKQIPDTEKMKKADWVVYN